MVSGYEKGKLGVAILEIFAGGGLTSAIKKIGKGAREMLTKHTNGLWEKFGKFGKNKKPDGKFDKGKHDLNTVQLKRLDDDLASNQALKDAMDGNPDLVDSWKALSEHYSLAQQFVAPINLNTLLEDASLASHLEIVEVKDHEIAIHYEDGNFKEILPAGKHAFWKGIVKHTFTIADLSKPEITESIHQNLLQKVEFVPYIRSFTVLLKELGLLYKNGELIGELQAGVHYFWKNTVDTQVLRTETRQQQLEIAGQEILTKDKANLRINFYAQYVVTDIRKALDENKEYQKQLYILIQLALREFIGTLTFDELLEKKQPVSAFIMETLQPKLVCLGVELNDCGIRDIILPGEMKEIMNQVLIAEKQAQAHTITRIDETASVRSMLNTAKLMEENEMLFKLKEMEYVDKIADKINSISLSGGNQVLDQLRDIFSVKK
jgi:hypothetical protein